MIWKGRLVFAREYGSPVSPYTKLLKAPRSTPSDRLAGLPEERCGAGEPPDCRPIEDPELVQPRFPGPVRQVRRALAATTRHSGIGAPYPGFPHELSIDPGQC